MNLLWCWSCICVWCCVDIVLLQNLFPSPSGQKTKPSGKKFLILGSPNWGCEWARGNRLPWKMCSKGEGAVLLMGLKGRKLWQRNVGAGTENGIWYLSLCLGPSSCNIFCTCFFLYLYLFAYCPYTYPNFSYPSFFIITSSNNKCDIVCIIGSNKILIQLVFTSVTSSKWARMITLDLNFISLLDCKYMLSKYDINNTVICRPMCLCSWQLALYVMYHTFFPFNVGGSIWCVNYSICFFRLFTSLSKSYQKWLW